MGVTISQLSLQACKDQEELARREQANASKRLTDENNFTFTTPVSPVPEGNG